MTCWHIYLQHGRPVLSDGSGGVIGGLVCRDGFNGKGRVAKWEGVDHNDEARAAWSLKVIRRLEAELGIEHWWRDGFSTRVMSAPRPGESKRQKKLPTIYGLCPVSTTHAGICNAPILDEGACRCRSHEAHARRRVATNEKWRAESAARRERQDRDMTRSVDLREIWDDVCDLYSIEPDRRGRPWVDGKTAHVDNEVLSTLLRTLIERT